MKADTPSSLFHAALQRGAVLFDRRKFFEAHEAWEERWLVETGEARRLLHGLIQVAAGFVKLQRRSPRGAVLNLDKGARKLAGLSGARFGLDLEPLLASVARWREVAASMDADGRTDYDAADLPRLSRRAGRSTGARS